MRFDTDYRYSDRETKAMYVWSKYAPILQESILDVGADRCYLKSHLPPGVSYTGVGLGGTPGIVANLERGALPFTDGSFRVVLCLDVLEHLDNPHFVFDELARVARDHIIIALPNPWSAFMKVLARGPAEVERSLKFYGLPGEAPEDRHKWFFSALDAENFVRCRAKKNNLRIVQLDHERAPTRKRGVKRALRQLAFSFLFRGGISREALFSGPLWAVLEKKSSADLAENQRG